MLFHFDGEAKICNRNLIYEICSFFPQSKKKTGENRFGGNMNMFDKMQFNRNVHRCQVHKNHFSWTFSKRIFKSLCIKWARKMNRTKRTNRNCHVFEHSVHFFILSLSLLNVIKVQSDGKINWKRWEGREKWDARRGIENRNEVEGESIAKWWYAFAKHTSTY